MERAEVKVEEIYVSRGDPGMESKMIDEGGGLAVPTVKAARAYGKLSLVFAVVFVVLIAMFVHALVTEHGVRWDVVRQYLFSHQILHGVLVTLELTGLAMSLGLVLGTVMAVCRMSPNRLLSGCALGYSWIFRGTPVLVQLILWFNLGLFIPRLSIGVPFGPTFVSAPTNHVMSALLAAMLGLGLNEAAYVSEIMRGGIASVGDGQTEAARSLGMSRGTALWRVILPQALRVIVPTLGNQVIGMLKWSSLASIISVTELLEQAEILYSSNLEVVPLLLVIAAWYLFLATILSVGQRYLERYLGRGFDVAN